MAKGHYISHCCLTRLHWGESIDLVLKMLTYLTLLMRVSPQISVVLDPTVRASVYKSL